MARKQKIVELDGRKYRVNEMPPLVARQVSLRWNDSISKDDLGEENQALFKIVMSHVEVETSPNVWMKLDSDEAINNNVSFVSMQKLADEVIDLTLSFLKDGENSQS